MREAFDAGQAARKEGKPLESMPQGYRATKSLKKAYSDGWRSFVVNVQEQDVRTNEPPVTVTALTVSVQYLPSSSPLPEYYVRHPAIACRKCRAVNMADGGKAVRLSATKESVAYLRCKACGGGFSLPIRP